jgi:predicted RNA-binding Zn ribbon-like protein
MTAGVRVLTNRYGVPSPFDPGSFCLELLLTGGPGIFARYEILHSPADLVAWLPGSRLAASAPLPAEIIRVTDGQLHDLVHFRDTFWAIALGLIQGKRPSPEQLLVVNGAAGSPPRPFVDPETAVRGWVPPVTGAQVLGAAARDAVELIAGAGSGRLRQCGADNCYLMFLDTSRPGTRRWCSMERCGNRQKVRGYRSRHST